MSRFIAWNRFALFCFVFVFQIGNAPKSLDVTPKMNTINRMHIANLMIVTCMHTSYAKRLLRSGKHHLNISVGSLSNYTLWTWRLWSFQHAGIFSEILWATCAYFFLKNVLKTLFFMIFLTLEEKIFLKKSVFFTETGSEVKMRHGTSHLFNPGCKSTLAQIWYSI